MKWLALLLAGAGWAAGCAEAQGLTLSPVMISAPADGGAASLTLTSGLAAPKLMQVRVFDWTQPDGGEQLIPSETVRFGPEIFELAPGMSQTVRFRLPDTDGAGTWKVVIDELPGAAEAAPEGSAQLSLRLRYILSMFAADAGDPASLTATAGEGGLELHNGGEGWLKLHGLELYAPDGSTVPAEAGIVYLLPGARVTVPVEADPGAYPVLRYASGPGTYTLDLQRAR